MSKKPKHRKFPLAASPNSAELTRPILVLGKKIKSERNFQGLSQTVLAQLSGVGLNFISQIESGKESAHIGKILNVLTTLGLQLKIENGEQGIRIDE